jgi:hypothetical protein
MISYECKKHLKFVFRDISSIESIEKKSVKLNKIFVEIRTMHLHTDVGNAIFKQIQNLKSQKIWHQESLAKAVRAFQSNFYCLDKYSREYLNGFLLEEDKLHY